MESLFAELTRPNQITEKPTNTSGTIAQIQNRVQLGAVGGLSGLFNFPL